VLALALAFAIALGGCGGGGTRQDASEPSGKFPVKIVTSSFPTRQHLAQTSLLRIGVQNSGQKKVPALAITISLDKNAIQPFSIFDKQPGVYTLDYQVDAGLEGKAKAVTSEGGPPTGSFVVKISDQPPNTVVNDNGEVVQVPQGANSLDRSGSSSGGGGGK
jgi:hypothetical protein